MQMIIGEKKTPVTLLALGITIALQMTALPTSAQQSPATAPPPAQPPQTDKKPEQLDTVQVVGTFRQSLVKALEEKRSSTDQIDSIVAEDIGKFPDLNLAESLQRIPGVSMRTP